MFAAGASGVVLDSQLFMCDEVPVAPNFKKLMGMVDESDSTEIIFIGQDIYRVFAKLGTKIVKDLKVQAVELTDDPEGREKLYQLIADNMTEPGDDSIQFIQALFYMGQDGVFAKDFVSRSTKISEVIPDLFKTIGGKFKFY